VGIDVTDETVAAALDAIADGAAEKGQPLTREEAVSVVESVE
jgi:hypothetical protein